VSNLLYRNPTALGVGSEGDLFGGRAAVVGRSVLKSADGYRWDEYHLKLAGGKETTLVYESGVWKRFDLYDPDTKLGAVDASDYGVGDAITLRDRPAVVSYVGKSRVAFIEGVAPEGYRVGSEAHYFNAEAGDHLFVVSWTGGEVEFYEGQNLPRGEVERAFGLPEPSLLAGIFSGASGSLDSWFEGNRQLAGTVLGACLFFTFIFFSGGGFSESPAEPPPPVAAPALRLAVKAQGDLAGSHYVITSHLLTDVSEMRGTFSRHEYDLTDDQGGRALLIQGISWDARQWYLFKSTFGPARVWPTPTLAATYRQGQTVPINGEPATVRTLFLCRTAGGDGDVPAGARVGSVRYGFTAQTKDGWLLAFWNDTDIDILAGRILSERDVQQAFGRGVSN
jgi:hypothetical protein